VSSKQKLKVKVKFSLCLTKHQAMETYWRSGGIAPLILDLGTRCRWAVSFTPRPHADYKVHAVLKHPDTRLEGLNPVRLGIISNICVFLLLLLLCCPVYLNVGRFRTMRQVLSNVTCHSWLCLMTVFRNLLHFVLTLLVSIFSIFLFQVLCVYLFWSVQIPNVPVPIMCLLLW